MSIPERFVPPPPSTLSFGAEAIYEHIPEDAASDLEDAFTLFKGKKKEIKLARRLSPTSVACPRGGHEICKNIERIHGLTFAHVYDKRSMGLPIQQMKAPFDLPLYDYQSHAVDLLQKYEQGTVQLACGGGKTRICMSLLSRLRRKTLVIMHTNVLVEQWIKVGSPFFKMSRVGDGSKDTSGDIVVATFDTMLPMLRADKALRESFGALVHDEAHHILADKYRDVMTLVPARYRIGVTATADFLGHSLDVIKMMFGGNWLLRKATELIEDGILKAGILKVIKTGYVFPDPHPDGSSSARMDRHLQRDPKRNALIASTVAREAGMGEIIAVISDRKEHNNILYKAFRAAGIKYVFVINGDTRGDLREQYMAFARKTRGSVIIATSVFDEGVDIPELTQLHVAFPQRSRRQITQRTARVLRKDEDTVKTVVEYVDEQMPLLNDRYRDRLKVYDEIGLIRDTWRRNLALVPSPRLAM